MTAQQRAIGFNLNPLASAVLDQRPLVEPWVQLNLVDSRDDARLLFQFSQMVNVEIADADCPGETFLLQFDQSFPGFDVFHFPRHGPMNQVQVQVIESEQ